MSLFFSVIKKADDFPLPFLLIDVVDHPGNSASTAAGAVDASWLDGPHINQQKRNGKSSAFFDDGKKKDSIIDELPVLGGLNELNATCSPLSLVIAISDPAIKEKLVNGIIIRTSNFLSSFTRLAIAEIKRATGLGEGPF